MDWSTRRKFGCLSVVALVILAIVAYFVYVNFFKVTPTCFDGKQNQNETGIDCGGICAMVCPMDAKKIVTDWTRVFPIANGVYSAVAYVENQNVDSGTEQVNYEFRVYDANNILAADPIDGTTFVGPNDKTAIYESPIQTGNRIPASAFFTFTSAPVWTKTDPKYQIPQIIGSQTNLTNIDTAPKLSAVIRNTSLFDYKNIQVVAVLYDASGNAVNASSTFIPSLAQQAIQKVYFTWPQKFTEPIAKIEIIPRLDPFIQK